MDPQFTWEQLLSAYAKGDWDRIQEHAEALLDWLDRGQCPPKILNVDGLGPDWDRALMRAGCFLALETMDGTWSTAT